MINKILDLILSFVKEIAYSSSDKVKQLKSELYNEAKELYCTNPELFERESLLLLNDKVPLLETDTYQTKMQCAKIWHKNGLDSWVFRIRFFLNLSFESDAELLSKKIKSAFSYREGTFVDRLDVRAAYEVLFYQILKTDDTEEQNLRAALEYALTEDIVQDVDGVIAYVTIQKYLKNNKSIPLYMKTVHTIVTSLSVIEGDGLHEWLLENKISYLKSLCISLEKIGLTESSKIARKLNEFLKDNPQAIQFNKKTDQNIIDQLQVFEKQLINSFDDDELMKLTEEYFYKYHNMWSNNR